MEDEIIAGQKIAQRILFEHKDKLTRRGQLDLIREARNAMIVENDKASFRKYTYAYNILLEATRKENSKVVLKEEKFMRIKM